MSGDNQKTVEALLGAARLSVSEEELQSFVRVYGGLREQADTLYGPDFDGEHPAVSFDPLSAWSNSAVDNNLSPAT